MSDHTVFLVLAGDTGRYRAELYAVGCVDAFVSPYDDLAHARFEVAADSPLDAIGRAVAAAESIAGTYVVMVEHDSTRAAAIVNAALQLRNSGAQLLDEERGAIRRLGVRDLAPAVAEVLEPAPLLDDCGRQSRLVPV